MKYRIIETTDGKYVGKFVEANISDTTIDFDAGFCFDVEKVVYVGDSTYSLSNQNYVALLREVVE